MLILLLIEIIINLFLIQYLSRLFNYLFRSWINKFRFFNFYLFAF